MAWCTMALGMQHGLLHSWLIYGYMCEWVGHIYFSGQRIVSLLILCRASDDVIGAAKILALTRLVCGALTRPLFTGELACGLTLVEDQDPQSSYRYSSRKRQGSLVYVGSHWLRSRMKILMERTSTVLKKEEASIAQSLGSVGLVGSMVLCHDETSHSLHLSTIVLRSKGQVQTNSRNHLWCMYNSAIGTTT